MLDRDGSNVAENFKEWKDLLDICMLASGSNEKDKKIQRTIILNCAGLQVVKLAEQFTYENEKEKDDPDVLLMKIAQYCNPRQSDIMQSFRFWKTNFHDSFDTFLNELRDKAALCSFKNTDNMIRDKLVFSVCDKLQQILLPEENLILKKPFKFVKLLRWQTKMLLNYKVQTHW